MQTMYIKADGKIKDIKPSNGKIFRLKELQEFVNGQIELVNLRRRGVYMVINQEGKLMGLPDNDGATVLWEEEFGKNTGDYIVGDVVIMQYAEFA